MMMTSGGLTSARTMRNSPFRESEWDRRLDHLLQDLENSTSSASPAQALAAETAAASTVQHQQSSAVVQAAYTASSSNKSAQSQQLQVQQENKQQSVAQQRSVSTDRDNRQAAELSQQSGYAQLSKSRSTNSLGQGAVVADNMLKDLDQALKASTNYIESHRTVQLPNGTQEIHEYRSTSSSGTPRNVGAGGGGDFNLERQVQHMMPSNLNGANGHGLQSANMVSSMQSSSQQTTSKSSYTSYKVQSNSYTSGGADRVEYTPAPAVDDNSGNGPERPGSRLKANIDELDTLLSDLNNAQRNSGGSTAHQSRHDNFVSSSEDYGEQNTMQGRVKTTVSSLNEYTTSGGGSEYRKPPSPSPKRRTPQPPATSVPIMSSPAMPPRRSSPSPSGRRGASPPTTHGLSAMSTANYSSASYNYNSSRGSSPPRKRSPSPGMPSGGGGGQSYYSKYQNQSSNYSSNQRNLSPASFPTCPSPSPGRGPSVQAPPKKVDDLLTELSEFDPSIQHTTFQEPPTHRVTTTKYTVDEDDFSANSRRREPSPIKPVKKPAQASTTPGPAVYYPPGELFSSTRINDSADCAPRELTPANGHNQQVEVSHTMEESSGGGSRGRAEMRAEYGYKSKSRYSETGDTKQGAAVVPICLPLCCAAPCVIL